MRMAPSPLLSKIYAESATQLYDILKKEKIEVPRVTRGRTREHRERYMVARLLATIATSGRLSYPITITHGDKPDFSLSMSSGTIGIECVEAVPEEWYEIEAMRERGQIESASFSWHFVPGVRQLSVEQKRAIAAGTLAGPPWVGKMPENQWARAMAYFIQTKSAKLQAGNYGKNTETWLLIQDEWRVPIYGRAELLSAAKKCLSQISRALNPGRHFELIFICSGETLIIFEKEKIHSQSIKNLWPLTPEQNESNCT